MASAVPAEAQWTLVDRLENWGRAMRNGWTPSRAESVEGDYRSQDGIALAECAPPRLVPIRLDDAREIESAVCMIDLYHHTLLVAWYGRRLAEAHCLRLAARNAGQQRGVVRGFDASLWMAHSLVADALLLPAV